MIIPKEIIEKTIEGGWLPLVGVELAEWKWRPEIGKYRFIVRGDPSEEWWHVDLHPKEIALDPIFCQALWSQLTHDETGFYALPDKQKEIGFAMAHRLYDLILTNGDTDKFWADLLK